MRRITEKESIESPTGVRERNTDEPKAPSRKMYRGAPKGLMKHKGGITRKHHRRKRKRK